MTIFNLPQDIFPGNKTPESIIIHEYAAPDGSFKGKSIMHTNAISLVTSHPKALLSFRSIKSNDFDDLEIRKAVEVNFANNITIEELAFLCNTRMSTFKRRFLKIYGTSPNKWIMQRRMEMAKELLLHHHEKPGDIYHKVGYETHSSFTLAFKQVFGVTPKELQLQQLDVFE